MRFLMPFQEKEEARLKACRLALMEGANRRALSRRLGISRSTLYKWKGRYEVAGAAGLVERSRRPHRSPHRTDGDLEAAVLAVRQEHPAWGGRKIAAVLRRRGVRAPAPSTITEILKRHGEAMTAAGQKPWQRFEHAEPNALWQMDFKGHVAFGGGRLHPLTIVDDHSRFSVSLRAADNERRQTVQDAMQEAFERYGLPQMVLADNGAPWGDSGQSDLTGLGVWLIEHGVALWHSPPCHPQSHGKNERFNRTLKLELLDRHSFDSLLQAQQAFDRWQHVYNHERPHDAIGLAVPADRYRPSRRRFNPLIEPFDYGSQAMLRRVDVIGRFGFANRTWKASKALRGKQIALQPTGTDGIFDVVFRHVTLKTIDLHR